MDFPSKKTWVLPNNQGPDGLGKDALQLTDLQLQGYGEDRVTHAVQTREGRREALARSPQPC